MRLKYWIFQQISYFNRILKSMSNGIDCKPNRNRRIKLTDVVQDQ